MREHWAPVTHPMLTCQLHERSAYAYVSSKMPPGIFHSLKLERTFNWSGQFCNCGCIWVCLFCVCVCVLFFVCFVFFWIQKNCKKLRHEKRINENLHYTQAPSTVLPCHAVPWKLKHSSWHHRDAEKWHLGPFQHWTLTSVCVSANVVSPCSVVWVSSVSWGWQYNGRGSAICCTDGRKDPTVIRLVPLSVTNVFFTSGFCNVQLMPFCLLTVMTFSCCHLWLWNRRHFESLDVISFLMSNLVLTWQQEVFLWCQEVILTFWHRNGSGGIRSLHHWWTSWNDPSGKNRLMRGI